MRRRQRGDANSGVGAAVRYGSDEPHNAVNRLVSYCTRGGIPLALFRARVVWQMRTAVISDRAVWSWGFEAAASPSAADLRSTFEAIISASHGGAQSLLSRIPSTMKTRAIEVYPAAGGAAVEALDFERAGTNSNPRLPGQVCLVATSQISTIRGVRPKGRTYYGPLTQIDLDGSTGAPTTTLIASVLQFSKAWHNALVGLGAQPVVLAGDGLTSRGNIVGYAVDNSFDTQRSRKFERTTLSTIVV